MHTCRHHSLSNIAYTRQSTAVQNTHRAMLHLCRQTAGQTTQEHNASSACCWRRRHNNSIRVKLYNIRFNPFGTHSVAATRWVNTPLYSPCHRDQTIVLNAAKCQYTTKALPKYAVTVCNDCIYLVCCITAKLGSCCKGHPSSQWEHPIFGGLPPKNC